MSHMNHSAGLAIFDEIQELSFDEIDNVGGAFIGPLILVVAVCATAYYIGRSQGDC